MIGETYEAQSARDAERMGYGDRRYWDYLEEAEKRNRDYWRSRGDHERAARAMTRSIGEALQGNDRD